MRVMYVAFEVVQHVQFKNHLVGCVVSTGTPAGTMKLHTVARYEKKKYNDTRFLAYVRSYRAPMTHAPRLNAPPMKVSGPFTLVPSDPGVTGSARPGVLVAVAAAIALAVLFG